MKYIPNVSNVKLVTLYRALLCVKVTIHSHVRVTVMTPGTVDSQSQ